MGIFRNFPYTNFHELNLDWLLSKMKELSAEWDKFVVNWGKEVKEEVDKWLTAHPEATTTVMDGSLTLPKFNESLKDILSLDINASAIGLLEGEENENHNNNILQPIFSNNDANTISIYFPADKEYYIGEITIARDNVKVYGEGKIHGTFEIGGTHTQHTNIEFYNLTIDADNQNCFILDNVTRLEFHDMRIINCDKVFAYSDRMTAQQVSRVKIYDNYIYNCNCALYGIRDPISSVPLIVADIHFINNIVEACKVEHIHVEGFDGGIISNNTFFFLSYMQTPAEKRNNIYIDYCNWTIISNNNLFEAGWSAIELVHSQSVNIIGNHIAWSGQREQKPAIYIHDLDVSGIQHFNFVNILGNNIVFPCSTGIKLDDVGHVKVVSNNMLGCGSDNSRQFFYGTWDPSIPSYGIDVDSDCMNIQITNNSMAQNGYRLVAANNVIFDENITTNGVEYRIKSTTLHTTLAANTDYGNIAIPSNYNVLAITPLYTSATSLAVNGQFNPNDNTIQLRRVVSSSTAEVEIRYKILYTTA